MSRGRRGLHQAFALALVVSLCLAGKPRQAYLRIHDTWTEHLKIYNNFGTVLLMDVTYLHPTFRRALAGERQRLLGSALTADDHASFVVRMDRDDAVFHEVIFGADSNRRAGRRFGETDDGWRLRLVADGVDETLESVYQVRSPSTLQLGLYPQLDNWNALWIARFRKTVENPDSIILSVGSGLGNGQLHWQDLRLR